MPRRGEKALSAPEMAQLISRQIRHAENARFLRRLPGFEVKRELPPQMVDLLGKLQEVESASGIRR
jgi:hypothetical protein